MEVLGEKPVIIPSTTFSTTNRTWTGLRSSREFLDEGNLFVIHTMKMKQQNIMYSVVLCR